MDRYTVHFI